MYFDNHGHNLFFIIIFMSCFGCLSKWHNELEVKDLSFFVKLKRQEIEKCDGSLIEDLQIHFLYVGEGDCIILRYYNSCLPEEEKEKTFLIDVGENISVYKKTDVIAYLEKLKIGKISYLILTHPHFDHYWNLGTVFKKFTLSTYSDLIDNFIYYSLKEDYSNIKLTDRLSMLEYKNRLGDPFITRVKGGFLNSTKAEVGKDIYNSEFFNVKIIGPVRFSSDGINSNSIVLLVTYHNLRFLFMGDADIEEEKDIIEYCNKNFINIENVDVIKIGHHGHDTSSSQMFVDKVKALNIVNSTGPHALSGGLLNFHEKRDIINRWKNSRKNESNKDVNVFSTREQGNIVVCVKQDSICQQDVVDKKYSLSFYRTIFCS